MYCFWPDSREQCVYRKTLGLISAMPPMIYEAQFSLQASHERVWDVLGIAVMRCLPLEQMRVQDESSFTAMLMVPMAFFRLAFNVNGLLELDPPNSLICLIEGESKWKLVQPKLRVGFHLKADGEKRTSIRFYALREGKGRRNIIEWLLVGKEKSFAKDIVNSVRKSLEQIV